MAGIDNKVVEMTFNNAIFERRIADTLKSLDKLNQSLKFSNAGAGVNDINSAVKGFNLNPMTSAIEGVSKKWLALTTVAITALANITNRAVDAGINIAKSLSLDQVIAGFREYELNIGSIQTILANTKADGTNLQQVNDALDELNRFADLTIFNFAEMTRNIGTFTAAGVDLDTSVNAIKGIANLAAISGSNSQQAATAMYQLSQAISTGSLRLQDWNSVVNAGLGGEVFQRALFETGKAMGTITDIPIEQTFDEWTEAGNSFRESLQEEWITDDVLINTLQGFTGDLTDAQLAAIGYTEAQIEAVKELGELGVESATKVRTLTQLIDTAKEAIASGWSQSFRTIFGDFEEATELFTEISEAVNDMIGNMSDARNNMLADWAALGGRTEVIDGLRTSFIALGEIITPIREAFRSIFPKRTGTDLFLLSERFREFAESLRPSEETVKNLRDAFKGFFSLFAIGKEIVLEGIGFIRDLFVEFGGVGSGKFLSFFADLGNAVSDLRKQLVDRGGIAEFFENLKDILRDPAEAIDNIRERFEGLSDYFDSVNLGAIFGPLGNLAEWMGERLEDAWAAIAGWLSGLGNRMALQVQDGDFNALSTIFSGAVLGGLSAALGRFFAGGGFSLFSGTLTETIRETFEVLTETLSAMQTEIKSNTLLKIASAIGILTASVVVLSAIDTDALAKALGAMAVAFAQLFASFALLGRLQVGPTSVATFTVLAGAMIVMSGALLVMSLAVRSFGSIDLENLAKGLGAVGIALGLFVATAAGLSRYSASLFTSGLGIGAIATAMVVLAQAVKMFGAMNLEELAKGLGAVAAGLIAIGLAMKLMPPGMVAKGIGILAISGAMVVLAIAVERIAELSWEEIGRGLAGVAGGLLAMAVAIKVIGSGGNLLTGAVAVAAISGAIYILAEALSMIAVLDWEDLTKGLVGVTVGLAAMAVASKLATGSVAGAGALAILSGGMILFAMALERLGQLSIAQIVTGIAATVGMILALGAVSAILASVAPLMLTFAVAAGALGLAMLALGGGAYLLATAFVILGDLGGRAVSNIIRFIGEFVKNLPALLAGIAQALLGLVEGVLKGLPGLIDELVAVFGALLQGLAELLPDIISVVVVFFQELLGAVRDLVPDLVETGYAVLLAFLQGLRDNMEEIVITVVEIITTFLDTLATQIPILIDSLFNFFRAVVEGVLGKSFELFTMMLPLGYDLIRGFFTGIRDFIATSVIPWFQALPGNILGWLGSLTDTLDQRGRDLISGFFSAVSDFTTNEIIPWFQELPENIFEWIGNVLNTLRDRGRDIVTGFFTGVETFTTQSIIPWFEELPGNIFGWIGDVLQTLRSRGSDILSGFFTGVTSFATETLIPWFSDLPNKIIGWIGSLIETLGTSGYNLIVGFLNGVIRFVNESLIPWFGDLGNKIRSYIPNPLNMLRQVGKDIIQGLWNGMKDVWGSLSSWAKDRADQITGWFTNPLGIFSPSRVMMEIGEYTMEGFQIGLSDGYDKVSKWADGISPSDILSQDDWNRAFQQIVAAMDEDFHPTITPVMDLSNVEASAQRIASLVGAPQIDTDYSYSQAAAIASTRRPISSDQGEPGEGGLKFEQNIYAPKQLSVSDIYRQTRNQLRVAAEELDIP